jgi:hypothetical protein
MSTRWWLRAVLAATGTQLLADETPRLVAPDDTKHLALDPRVIVSASNARLVPGIVVKEPRNPLMRAGQPWENALNNLYPNVLWEGQERVFKLWYKCVLFDKDVIARMDPPGTVHDVGWYLLYATSKDGTTWERPALDLHKFDGRGGNNIVARDTPNVGVFKDPHEADPGRRYKMVYDVGLGKPRVRFSADGVRWSEPVEPQGFGAQNGDTHNNAFWDERLRRYLWFTKLYIGERTVARLESEDFIHWRNSGMVLRSALHEGRSSQTYALTPFRYGNIWLGYLMMYHVAKGRTVDCELAWSPDSITWRRVAPGVPFIPRGPKGTYDSECIYAMAGPPIAKGSEVLVYYGGSDFPHTGWKRHCLLSLARLPLDRFAGFEPVEKGKAAVLESGPLRIDDGPLRINADAGGGSVRVTALRRDGTVLAESEPVAADVLDATVRWRVGTGELRGKPVKLRIELMNARLFALSGATLVETELPEPVNPHRERASLPAKTARITFDRNAEGWKGLDRIEHHAEGGTAAGYVSATRAKGLAPFVFLPADAPGSPLAGDWSQRFGGRGAMIGVSVRSPKVGGRVKIELFAGDIAQWTFTGAGLGDGWTRAEAKLRYGWSDAEARAAGWQRGPTAFSWAETIANVGKVVVIRDGPRDADRIDVDEFSVTGEP